MDINNFHCIKVLNDWPNCNEMLQFFFMMNICQGTVLFILALQSWIPSRQLYCWQVGVERLCSYDFLLKSHTFFFFFIEHSCLTWADTVRCYSMSFLLTCYSAFQNIEQKLQKKKKTIKLQSFGPQRRNFTKSNCVSLKVMDSQLNNKRFGIVNESQMKFGLSPPDKNLQAELEKCDILKKNTNVHT